MLYLARSGCRNRSDCHHDCRHHYITLEEWKGQIPCSFTSKTRTAPSPSPKTGKVHSRALSLVNTVVLVSANVKIGAMAMIFARALLFQTKLQESTRRFIKLWECFDSSYSSWCSRSLRSFLRSWQNSFAVIVESSWPPFPKSSISAWTTKDLPTAEFFP